MNEPILRVGLAQERSHATLTLNGKYLLFVDNETQGMISGEDLELTHRAGKVHLKSRQHICTGEQMQLIPYQTDATFTLKQMVVGISFHWEHAEDLTFQGAVIVQSRAEGFDIVSAVPLEQYLVSVISSEMSHTSPPAFLEAHAVISRSWLLAQLQGKSGDPAPSSTRTSSGERTAIRRWYDREDHEHFDVCADDHCQRYQGVTRASNPAAREATERTRGLALVFGSEVCDARFSKCCGGVTELFSSAWGDQDPGYLQSFADSDTPQDLELTSEHQAVKFIKGSPDAWCNTADRELLERVLPELDHETTSFYRWEEELSQEKLQRLLKEKIQLDLGEITALKPLERGPSSRITRLLIQGSSGSLIVGKELEIRRILSDSHLYSSAFIVSGGPEVFKLRGAGWGHGVGLCQIGAAAMGAAGRTCEQILEHYYRGSELKKLY